MSCPERHGTTFIRLPPGKPVVFIRRIVLLDGLGREVPWAALERQAGRRGALLVFAGM